MLTSKNNKARHLILQKLQYHSLQFSPKENHPKVCMHFNDIHKMLPQYDRDFLLDNLDYLRTAGEVYCSMKFDDSVFRILSPGSHAYRDQKYIKESIQKNINYFYDFAKTISVVVLLVLALYTFYRNFSQTDQNQNDINQLKKRVERIEKSAGR